MNFRSAEINDISALVQLRIEYLNDDLGIIEKAAEMALKRDLTAYFNKHLNNDMHAFIAIEGENTIACALLLLEEKPMSPSFPNGRTGTVFNVYTRPEYRKKGAARTLMTMLLECAREMELSKVELKATNDGYPLYKSLGFSENAHEYVLMSWRNPTF